MTESVRGLHHITAIAGDAQENLDFYVGVLGMRLVKRSVNQDDPGTYHLFYADAEGHHGTDLTFFPWAQLAPGRKGHGLTDETLLAVPAGSLDFWRSRLERYGVTLSGEVVRFGEKSLRLTDPHGLDLALVETGEAPSSERPFTPWPESTVPADRQVRGLHGARVQVRDLTPTEHFLTEGLGFARLHQEDGWVRFAVAGGGTRRTLDVREVKGSRLGQWGTGSVHHLAWTVDNEAHGLAVREQVAGLGARPTEVIDRFWFKSIYFREPGGVLFELATKGPGFAVDEDPARLGERLILPPWLEPRRPDIEAVLPDLRAPQPA
jgi:glyoxalase family protein